MLVNIITNIREVKGLYRDAEILETLLISLHHTPVKRDFRDDPGNYRADLNIFLEVCPEKFFAVAPRHWLIPNPEWWLEENNKYISRFERVLCKTHDAVELFKSLHGSVEYLGFESRDNYNPKIPRDPMFFHNPGGSIARGTIAVLDAWEKFKFPWTLTVVGKHIAIRDIRNVTYFRQLTDEEIKYQQNRHIFHILPSEYEGWGHSLHEALGVGAVVITTDAPPMNMAGAAYHVPVAQKRKQNLATRALVDEHGVKRAIDWCISSAIGSNAHRCARDIFLLERDLFRARFACVMGSSS